MDSVSAHNYLISCTFNWSNGSEMCINTLDNDNEMHIMCCTHFNYNENFYLSLDQEMGLYTSTYYILVIH